MSIPVKPLNSANPIDHRLSVAPMLDWTDRHCRYFYRVMSKHTVLYTEMITTGAIIFGKGDYLSFNKEEHPLALQLGGSDVKAMTECAKMAEQYGYDEININVGCPSDRVQNGRFGACLMAEPSLVADCVNEMQAAANVPVTVKSRIGIDDNDSYEFLHNFIDVVAQADCKHFIIHARKAWLSGLSPKQNREVPPLDYGRVYQIKKDFSQLQISINGGIKTFAEANEHLTHIDGVMIGREIYQNPYMLVEADNAIYQKNTNMLSRAQIIEEMARYIDMHIANGGRAWHVVRHMLGLCNGLAGARQFRRYLSEQCSGNEVTSQVLFKAFALVTLPASE
ncbi:MULTISPECIES: tRNA dihydrouridine(20/20a) synthase DusA [unclassified Colwellia]|uniref:tRNA dihydrouridine(20/20a) synthase DusA n=1 Tax=unclassified Colwellia TaxID=196834 RepID=UPI0015F67D00|nr:MULTISPECIES: tRNA dihydrouridine(20/20a) synthase DusA [unclassified Colwellia]MBA6303205.1 tRNA dihydrouridine(20/20a) synthase DusA [Colwellia sp. MB02u-14]